MPSFLVVMVTCPSRAVAKRLGTELVKRRLAACVNVVPDIESIFWWQGKIDRADETLLLIKTTSRGFEPLRRAVCALHPYEVPEIIALPIVRGHPPYLRWIHTSLSANLSG
ncbi:MAG: divalent-cation tolerance protein CutA [Candidatus Omnitrophota bacterium]|nr:divalent-cation tolerance protein CutA [Candidatus Omnitrophota bacterium]